MNFRTLICLALIHFVVDAYSQFVAPLWPEFQETHGLGVLGFTFLFNAWLMSVSISQPIFGYLTDRFGSWRLISLGPAIAIVSISSISFADGPIMLGFLLVLGGLGIGGFHPESVVTVADSAGKRRTLALSIFICGGMTGLGIGPFLSGVLTQEYGLQGLMWIALPAAAIVTICLMVGRPQLHVPPKPKKPVSLGHMLEGRRLMAGLLLGVGTFRVVAALGVPLVLAFSLDAKGYSKGDIGFLQSLFLMSGGIGTLFCPLLVRPGQEISATIWTSFLAVGCQLLLLIDQPWALYIGLIGCGLTLQGAMPILINYSQYLLPNGRRLGASLVMGATWGLGGILVAQLQAIYQWYDNIEGMLWGMIPFTLIASIAAFWLPTPEGLDESLVIRDAEEKCGTDFQSVRIALPEAERAIAN